MVFRKDSLTFVFAVPKSDPLSTFPIHFNPLNRSLQKTITPCYGCYRVEWLLLGDDNLGVVVRNSIIYDDLDCLPSTFFRVEDAGHGIEINVDDELNSLAVHGGSFQVVVSL